MHVCISTCMFHTNVRDISTTSTVVDMVLKQGLELVSTITKT